MRLGAAVIALGLIILAGWPALSVAGHQGQRTPDVNGTLDTADPISSGVAVSDSVNATDDVFDYYKIGNVVAGQTIKASLTFSSNSASLNVSVRDPYGNNLTVVYWGGLTRGNTALATVNGTYYIEVKADTGASAYTLTVWVAYPPVLGPGAQLGGTLSSNGADRTDFYRLWLDGNVSGRGEVAMIAFTQADQRYLLQANLMDILNWNGSHIYNETSNVSARASLSAAASYTGWYYVELAIWWGTTGYTVNFTKSEGGSDGNNDPANATLVPHNAAMSGYVNKARDHYDWYAYRVAASDNLQVKVDRVDGYTDFYWVIVYNSRLEYIKGSHNWNGGGTVNTVQLDLLSPPVDDVFYVEVEVRNAYRADPLWRWTDDEAYMAYTITFTSPNHPPLLFAAFENLTMTEDGPSRLNMSVHFSDMDGDELNFSLSGAAHVRGSYSNITGELTLTPSPNWNGREIGYITADDGHYGRTQAVIGITVLPVEDPPAALAIPAVSMAQNGKDGSLDLSKYFYDNDTQYGDRLTYGVSGNGSIQVSITSQGKVTLTAPIDFWGEMNTTFTATDNASLTASSVCRVTVYHVNQAPQVKASPPDIPVNEDDSVTMDFSPVFWDPDGDPITITPSGNVQIDVAQLNGTLKLTFTPKPDVSDLTEAIRLTAKDDSGLGDNYVTVKVTVNPVNDPPRITSFSPLGDLVLKENNTQEFSINAIDPESGILLNYTWFLDGQQALVGVTGYVLRTNYTSAGDHAVMVTVSDGEATATKIWNVTVENVNREPVEVGISSPKPSDTVRQGLTVMLAGDARDPDGDGLTFVWFEGSKELGTGRTLSLLFQPGSHTIALEVSDAEATVRTRAVNFVVRANSAPQMQSLSPSMDQRFNKGDRVQFAASFTDPDNDALAYCWSERGTVLSTSPSFVKSDLPAGKHVISLSVSDGGAVTYTNLTIEVVAPGTGTLPMALLAGAGAAAAVLVAAIIVTALRLRRRQRPPAVLEATRVEGTDTEQGI